jgi:uncharacterized membrane protein HdeD (DUF308 family)
MDKGWWLILVLGIVSVAAGVLAVLKPDITVLALVLVMGVNALLTGALDLGVAIRLRKALHNEWLLILNGVASLAFGVLVLIFPAAGAFALVWLVSFYAVVSGILLLSLAFRLRALASRDDVSAFQSAVHH